MSERTLVSIDRESSNCWHEIGWDSARKAIVIRIWDEWRRKHLKFPVEKWIAEIQQRFNLPGWSGDLERPSSGFGGALRFQAVHSDGFLTLEAPIPRMRRFVDEPCYACDGEGVRNGDECFFCEGTGKEYGYDHRPGKALCQSLWVLSFALRFPEGEITSNRPQLYRYDCGIGDRFAHVGGEVSGEFADWIADASEEVWAEACLAMLEAHEAIEGRPVKNRMEAYWFQAIRNDSGTGFGLSCPGSATSIGRMNPPSHREGGGYQLSCHNVDTSIQTLTLLAGMARLHDLARRDLSQKEGRIACPSAPRRV